MLDAGDATPEDDPIEIPFGAMGAGPIGGTSESAGESSSAGSSDGTIGGPVAGGTGADNVGNPTDEGAAGGPAPMGTQGLAGTPDEGSASL